MTKLILRGKHGNDVNMILCNLAETHEVFITPFVSSPNKHNCQVRLLNLAEFVSSLYQMIIILSIYVLGKPY